MENAALGNGRGDQKAYAGFWLRVVACLIDGIIVGIPSWILSLIGAAITAGLSIDTSDPYAEPTMENFGAIMFVNIALIVVLTVMTILYMALCHSSKWQATVGKKVLGLKVTDLNGNRISFGRAVGRYFAMIVSGLILYIGYMMAGFTEKKQALHDMIAGTLVVKDK